MFGWLLDAYSVDHICAQPVLSFPPFLIEQIGPVVVCCRGSNTSSRLIQNCSISYVGRDGSQNCIAFA